MGQPNVIVMQDGNAVNIECRHGLLPVFRLKGSGTNVSYVQPFFTRHFIDVSLMTLLC
jgi:hypothetical protein